MPKYVCHLSWINENGGDKVWDYDVQNKIMECNICHYSVRFGNLRPLRTHVNSLAHIKKITLYQRHSIRQDDIGSAFVKDLTTWLITSNIPFSVTELPLFQKFIGKYAKKTIPSRRILSSLVQPLAIDVMSKIKEEIGEKDIFVSVGAATDYKERSLTAMLIGPLDGMFLGKPYLIELSLMSQVSKIPLERFILKSVHQLFGETFINTRIKVLVTDGTSTYFCTGDSGLKTTFPHLIHVTCVAHELYRVAELVFSHYSASNFLISSMKTIFMSSPKRIQEFTALCHAPGPPMTTKKGTWFRDVSYYVEHFDSIKLYINNMSRQNDAIKKAKSAINQPDLLAELKLIKYSLYVIPDSITALEGRLPLPKSFSIIDKARQELDMEPFKTKLNDILIQNPGLFQLRDNLEKGIDDDGPFIYRNAPIVCSEVERVFSILQDLDSPKRSALSLQNMKNMMIIKWNNV